MGSRGSRIVAVVITYLGGVFFTESDSSEGYGGIRSYSEEGLTRMTAALWLYVTTDPWIQQLLPDLNSGNTILMTRH